MPKVQQKHYDSEGLQSSYKTMDKKIDVTQSSDKLGHLSKMTKTQDYIATKPKVPFYSDTSQKVNLNPKLSWYKNNPCMNTSQKIIFTLG
jgi:hypothetical protein